MTKSVHVTKHDCAYKFDKDANKYLQLADAFLEAHPEIIFWTEKNSTKKGLFYRYKNGLFSAISTLEVEQLLIAFKPTDAHIVIPSLLSQGKQMETMNNIMRRRFFYREDFNPEGVINFQNGFYYVEEEALKPHSMTIISTNQLPYNYDTKAECPNFMKALTDATEGDPFKMGTIQEFAGYCLIRKTHMEKVLFLIGSAGSGKSTVLEGIETMLGKENVSSTSMEQLCQPRYAGNFIDKIANIASEIPKNIKDFESALNKIVSGESVMVDTKFIPSYDARPYCKLIFAGNDMPVIADTSNSVFRRMLLIYFNNVVDNQKIDRNLKYKIREEGSGIFNWAMEGLRRLKKNGEFTQSEEMLRDIDELKVQNNGVYYFITENYDIGLSDESFIIGDDLYESFKAFCHHVGAVGIFKLVMFNKELKKIFPKKIRHGQKWTNGTTKKVWLGIRRKETITGWTE
jgi:putative DNA primase/helicase